MKTKTLHYSVFSVLVLTFLYSFTLYNPTIKALIIPENGVKFEGEIAFTKKVGNSESKYKYLVKGDNVRIEELGDDGSIKGIMLVNTTKNSVLALNPLRKMYMEVPPTKKANTPTIELTKNETTKAFNGYTCKEWTAKDTDQDRVIVYYLAFDNFHFLTPLLNTLNRRDKQALFYLAMAGTEGAFPMLSIEKKLDGTEISRLTVTNISKKELETSQFEIPSDYTKSGK